MIFWLIFFNSLRVLLLFFFFLLMVLLERFACILGDEENGMFFVCFVNLVSVLWGFRGYYFF